jgi:Holliday junction resolvasome RuvABC ATP-dependent DNA helicase subunit
MLKVQDDRIISSHWQEEDDSADTSIRPLRLADYIGQERVKEKSNSF